MTKFPTIKDTPPTPASAPMSKMANEVSEALAKQKDELVRAAISKHLGREDWTLEDVLPHVRRVPIFTHPAPCGTLKCEVFSFGETPILEVYPAEMSGKGGKMTWKMNHRMLV